MPHCAKFSGGWKAPTPLARKRDRPESKRADVGEGKVDPMRPWESLVLATQYVVLLALNLVLPLLMCEAARASVAETEAVLSRSLLVGGLATILHARNGRWFGAGYFLPTNLASVVYYAACLHAARLGGLPLVCGLTVLAGLVELAMAFSLLRIKKYIPTKVLSLVLVMLGFEIAAGGAGQVLGSVGHHAAGPSLPGVTIGLVVAMICIVSPLLGGATLRRYSPMVALALGGILGALWGQLAPGATVLLDSARWFLIPSFGAGLELDHRLVPAFLLGALVAGTKTMGTIHMAQAVQGRPFDMSEASRATAVDGLCSVLAGLLGTMGVNPSPGGVALSNTTHVFDRRMGYYVGGMLVVLAFVPRVAAMVMVLPAPVAGALLFFIGTLQMLQGMQELFTNGWSERDKWTLGFPMAMGMTREFFPAAFRDAPLELRPFLESPMTVTVMAVVPMFLLARLKAPTPEV